MHETPEQKAAREAAERRWQIRLLAGKALTGIIRHYVPNTLPPVDEGREMDLAINPVPQLSPEQITEIGLAAYELAEATLQAIELGEKTQADAAAPTVS